MAFTTRDDIAIDGVGVSIFVFVKFLAGGNPEFTFCKDAAAEEAYSSHDYEVPPRKKCGIYFWLTANSDNGAHFPSEPCNWNTGQPPTVSDGYMTSNSKGFSIEVDNENPPTQDESFHFKLVVDDDQNVHHVSQVYEVDPTIVEKGDPGTF